MIVTGIQGAQLQMIHILNDLLLHNKAKTVNEKNSSSLFWRIG